MHLSNIKLWNFRKFGSPEASDYKAKPHLDLNLNKGLNVIIGENDSGKTAIIDAIKLVLKTHAYEYIRADEKDFYKESDRFRIELTFEGFEPEEAKNFTEWLGWKGTGEDAEPILKLNYDVSKKDGRILPADVKAGFDEEGYILTAEAKEYLKATYLKPLRDAENELVAKRNSRLSQILLSDEAFKGKEKDNDLITIFSNLKDELEKFFNEDGEDGLPKQGKLIKAKIDEFIKGFYGQGKETVFVAASTELKGILEKLTLSLKDEANPGLGTLNRLFMAAELLHLTKSNWTGLRLGLVEELEAHLHPQAQMQVIEALQKQKNIQLILTTHSPNLASKVELENLIICNNGNAFPMGHTYTKLKKEDYKFLEKFLDTTKANLFFAKGVILVEGWAEEILLPSIAKAMRISLTEKGVSIVNIGHTGFEHYSKIYLRQSEPYMKIPVAVIADSDIKVYERIGDNFEKRDAEIVNNESEDKIKEISNKSEQNVKFFAAPQWTLEYSLFKSTTLKTIFKEVVKSVHTATDWETDFEKELAKKLINKGLNKTEIAYRIANVIDEDLKSKTPTIQIIDDAKDAINYLIQAIKYATKD